MVFFFFLIEHISTLNISNIILSVRTFTFTGAAIDLRESGRKAARVRNVMQEVV